MKSRRDYHKAWVAQHPGYKSAASRKVALLKVPKRAFYGEILGVRVRVNLLNLKFVDTLSKSKVNGELIEKAGLA